MICPGSKNCTKIASGRYCCHAAHHELNEKCENACSHSYPRDAGACIDETLIERTGKFTKLTVGEKSITVWSK